MMFAIVLRLLLFLTRGGESLMAIVTVYVTLIIAGRRTFEQVPASLQDAVESDLLAQGLGTDGKPLGSA